MKKLLLSICLLFPTFSILAQNVFFSGEVRRTGDLAPIPGVEVKIRDINDPASEIFNSEFTQGDGTYFISYMWSNPAPLTLQVVVTDCNNNEVIQTVQYNGGDTSYSHTITICQNNNCTAKIFPYFQDEFNPMTLSISTHTNLIPAPVLTLNWGDGTEITGNIDYILQNNQHTYTSSGLKNICLTADNGLCNTTNCVLQWVGGFPGDVSYPPCSTDFEFIFGGNDPDLQEYYFTVEAPADNSLRYMWFVNNWPVVNSTVIENSASLTLTTDPTAVSLMTYKSGCISTITKNIVLDTNLFNSACFNVADTVSVYARNEAILATAPENLLFDQRMYSGVKNPINIQLYGWSQTDSTVALHSAVESPIGVVRFENVPVGAYIGRGLYSQNSPDYGVYMPTYFGFDADPNAFYYSSVKHWYEAYTVGFSGAQYPEFYQTFYFTMLPVVNSNGNGQVGGGVDWQDTLKSNTNVQDVTIWAQNIANGKIYGYAISDANGVFNISGLPYGTYYIDGDYPGYYTTHDTITLDESNPAVNNLQIMILEQMEPLLVKEASVDVLSMFPNPTGGNVSVTLNTKKETNLAVTVYNMLGQPVYTQKLKTGQGVQTVELSIENLPQGMYTLLLTDTKTQQQTSKKLVKY